MQPVARAACCGSAARVYIRGICVFASPHGHGRPAFSERAMAAIGPNGVAGARAPRAVGAALAIDRRLVPRHSRDSRLTAGSAALPDATRLWWWVRTVSRWDRAWWSRVLAQVGLARLQLHGGGTMGRERNGRRSAVLFWGRWVTCSGRHRTTGRRAGRARASQSQTAAEWLQVVRWRLH